MPNDHERNGAALSLTLPHPERLFDNGAADPMRPDYDCISGIDRMIEAVSARRDLGRRSRVFELRFENGGDAVDEAALEAAIGRYCAAHADDLDRQAQVKRREGVQTAYLASIFVAAAVLLSILVYSLEGLPPLLQVLLSDGLVIAGWVAVWRPIDLLLFEPWLLARQARILRNLGKMKISIVRT